jgi:serine/threonine protein kinase
MNDLLNIYLGQYYLIEVIGRGSTSVLYKAYQSSLNRYVAVKVLATHIDPQLATRFTREAHAVAQLQHPNILPIYDYGEQGGYRYFVMQYIESGATLDDTLSGQPMEPLTALRLMLPLLSALKYAHARGVVHRDIKPANIMMPRPDWPLLADFGIAKMIDDSQQLTPPGQSVGTAIYMAPERATTTAADVRTDLYSVGVVLYEMLTGKVPFDGLSPVDVLRKHIHAAPPPPLSVNPGLPTFVEPMLLQALAKRPVDRYQSAADMTREIERVIGQIERLHAQRELQRLLQQPPSPAAMPNPYETREFTPTPSSIPAVPRYAGAASPARRGPWLPIGVAVLLLLLTLGGFVLARETRGAAEGTAAANATMPATQPQATEQIAMAPTAAIPTTPPVHATASPEPLQPSPEAPLPSPEPQATQEPQTTPAPTASPRPPALLVSTPQVSQSGDTALVRFEDTDWQGGFRPGSGRTYGGRTATWIYGTSTEYSTMRASFGVVGQPSGTASLTVEGMDSENNPKTLITIAVNGVEIYNGPNPLPDDDHPLETGTWASYTWTFDASIIRPGRNEISIGNLDVGEFSRPPFFMLDYAELTYTRA